MSGLLLAWNSPGRRYAEEHDIFVVFLILE
jgi:hypothetical protein